MPWTVEFDVIGRLVVVTGYGEMSDTDAGAQAANAISFLRENQSNHILIDYREAQSEVSLPRLYWLPDYFSELGAPWNLRLAVVLPRSRYRVETYQFFELVCKNAGYHVSLFETKEAAQAWLEEDRALCARGKQPAHA